MKNMQLATESEQKDFFSQCLRLGLCNGKINAKGNFYFNLDGFVSIEIISIPEHNLLVIDYRGGKHLAFTLFTDTQKFIFWDMG